MSLRAKCTKPFEDVALNEVFIPFNSPSGYVPMMKVKEGSVISEEIFNCFSLSDGEKRLLSSSEQVLVIEADSMEEILAIERFEVDGLLGKESEDCNHTELTRILFNENPPETFEQVEIGQLFALKNFPRSVYLKIQHYLLDGSKQVNAVNIRNGSLVYIGDNECVVRYQSEIHLLSTH